MFTSLNTGTLSFTVPLDEGLALARANGFAALDLPMAELRRLAEQTSIQAVQDRFSAAGVRPGGWSLPVNWRGDEGAYQDGLAELPRAVALAQALGSPWCTTVIMPYSDERDHAANLTFHVERLRPAARILAEHGCRLGLEFVGTPSLRAGHAHEFVSTMAGALDLGERLGSGNVGLLLDCFHWYTSRGTIEDIARLRPEQVVYVHLNDAREGRDAAGQIDTERRLPGASGLIDIVGFLQALERIGFDGPAAVEPFDEDVRSMEPAERVRVTAESLARVWRQAGLSK